MISIGVRNIGSVGLRSQSSFSEDVGALCREGKLERALDALRLHRDTCHKIPQDVYLLLLHACGEARALDRVRQVHALLARHDLQLSGLLGDYLVASLAKCGSLDDARSVLLSLPCRSVYPWTALLSGYTTSGDPQEALKLHRHMREDGVEPNEYTFATIFKACSLVPDIFAAKKLHIEAQWQGFCSDVFVVNSLVSMYGKFGSILDAEIIFGGFVERNIVSWNAMLSAYVEQGHGNRAILLYRQMEEEGVDPNEQTFLITLQACVIFARETETCANEVHPACLKIGQAVHVAAQRKGFVRDEFVGNTLVCMYGNCGSIMDVERMFYALPKLDVVSWSTLISACVKQGHVEKALRLFVQMLQEGVCPNRQTYLVILPACGSSIAHKRKAMAEQRQLNEVKSLEIGQALHADCRSRGFTLDLFINNTLIGMYGKCGSIVKAENVFLGLTSRDDVSWNAILSAYVVHSEDEKALLLYRQMQNEGEVSPNQETFLVVLQACCGLAGKAVPMVEGESTTITTILDIGQALHASCLRQGFTSDIFVLNTLLNMYGKHGKIAEANNLFDRLSQPTVVSWTAMLLAYAEHGQGRQALQLYMQMQEEGVSPDQQALLMGIQACRILVEEACIMVKEGVMFQSVPLEIGKSLHADGNRAGFTSNNFVGSTLIKMYGKCGSVGQAECVFDVLPERNIVSWNAMLSAYMEEGEGEKVLKLFRKMQEVGVTLDHVTIMYILEACRTTGSLDVCKQIHFNIVAAEHDETPLLGNALIRAYSRCALMEDAHAVFDGLAQRDAASWAACIAGYAQDGNPVVSLQLYEDMQLAGIDRNGYTFFSLLSVCRHAGLVEKGIDIFESMIRDHAMILNYKHRLSFIDLLGRTGEFKVAEHVLEKMPLQNRWAAWVSIMAACLTYGNVDLGKLAFDHAVELKPKEATAYVLMFKIYADAGMQNLANEVETLRLKGGSCRGIWVLN